MSYKKVYSLLIILLLSLNGALAQRGSTGGGGWGIAPSIAYNPQTKSVAVGFRLNIKPSQNLRFVPQALYYPAFSFNKIHEYHIGLGVEYTVFKNKIVNLYPLLNVGYNAWLNTDDSDMKDAKSGTYLLELGAGISFTQSSVRPFLETRYNIKWKETSVHIGLLFVLGGNSRYKKRNRRRPVICPAYN